MTARQALTQRLARHLPAEQAELAPALAGEAAEWAQEAGTGEAERTAEAERLRALFDAVYDPIFLIDPNAERIVDANAAAAAMLGFPQSELTRLGPHELHPFEMEYVADFFAKVRTHGRWQTRELSCRRRDGRLIPAEMSGTCTTVDGRECLVVVARDLRQHQLALLGTAVSKVAHDLRNVLHSMQLFSRALRRVEDPVVHQVLPRLQATVDRAIRMCDATLAHGRVQEPAPQRRFLQVRALAEEVAEMAGVAEHKAIEWVNAIPAELTVAADGDQLFRVLLNLCRNAARAIEEGDGRGEVRVEGERGDAGVRLDVADTGPGLPAPLESLVDVQNRVPWGTHTGLGLSIARDLVAAHGGTLEVAASGEAGTRFTVWLPDAPAPDENAAR